jgi:hypothetical protein
MHFSMKNTLKNNRNYTFKQVLNISGGRVYSKKKKKKNMQWVVNYSQLIVKQKEMEAHDFPTTISSSIPFRHIDGLAFKS